MEIVKPLYFFHEIQAKHKVGFFVGNRLSCFLKHLQRFQCSHMNFFELCNVLGLKKMQRNSIINKDKIFVGSVVSSI